MSEPIRCVKATIDSIQDPKMLAVLKAIYGSKNPLGWELLRILNNKFAIFDDISGEFAFIDSIVLSLKEMNRVLEPRLLIGEGINFQYRLFDGPKEVWYDAESNAIHSFIKRDAVIRLSEDTLKEIGFEVVEVEA